MGEQPIDTALLQKELSYYKRQADAVAGENLKLDYTLSGLRHELRQKRQGFALLSELQQSIGAHKQISGIFEITAAAVNATLGMDKTVILTPTNNENQYRPSHWLGFHEEAAHRLFATSLDLPQDVIQGLMPLLVNKSSATTPFIEQLQATFALPFFVCVPILVESTPIGVLVSGRLKEVKPLYPPLDQGDLDTFQAISGLISASVRNMRVAVLEEMDRLKTEFFANVSHEFRTPITLTLGPTEQLLEGRFGEVSEPAREQLRIMKRNQERLLGLINQILDLAKLEAGGMQLRAAPVEDINRFVEERTIPFRSVAEKRGVELKLFLDPDARGVDLFVDQEKLDKLIGNLLSNALKFTPSGSIEVSTEVRRDLFRLTVSDTGIGIKEDQLPYVFDRFRQADGSASREYAGTGIGLALVQEIARLHGGDVTVHSRHGHGTAFRLTIPLGKAHLDPSVLVTSAAGTLSAESDARRVLLIRDETGEQAGVEHANNEAEADFDPAKPTIVYAEDNTELRNHVRDILRAHYNVFVAGDGRDGLEKIQRYRPDLVISDGMMPNMTGRDLLQAIRTDPEVSSTPVIFLTARGGTEARIAGLDAGADDYLAKPFHQGELLARTKNLLRARSQERELAELNRRLEIRVEEQMAELVSSGELRRFLPHRVAESVLRGQLGATEHFERRKITVLFADLVGFTDLSDLIEPEELSFVLNEFLREMTAVAIAHGGTVDKFIGDSVMVLFGAPEITEVPEQAWAAVQAADAMRIRVKELNALARRRGIPSSLDVRIGINTGYCTVGVFGSDLLRSYTAIGTQVNVAARLESEAEAGGILCSFATYALIQDRVVASARGPVTLRGIARPVEVYAISETARQSSGGPA